MFIAFFSPLISYAPMVLQVNKVLITVTLIQLHSKASVFLVLHYMATVSAIYAHISSVFSSIDDKAAG